MADLDKYLADLGINVNDDSASDDFSIGLPPVDEETAHDPLVTAAPLEGPSKERCETFLANLLLHFDPIYTVEVRDTAQGALRAHIHGGEPGKIIGRGGRTLSALEYLTNVVVNRGEDEARVRINLDVGDYRRRRDDRLRQEARRAVGRVRKTGQAVTLDPMDASERRVVHLEIGRIKGVESESTGEGKQRRVIIKPASSH